MITTPSSTSSTTGATSATTTSTTTTTTTTTKKKRGAFILLEGIDRCGKTTQCGLLLKHLTTLGIASVAMRFPDRTTTIGQLINSYLTSGSELDDHSIHLLFSANRWESVPTITKYIYDEEKTIICDRYAYSGVAFTSSKSINNPSLTIDWCKSPDIGLPAPDVIIFLDLSQDDAEKRGGYGNERYEKRDMQLRVRKRFDELQKDDVVTGKTPWHIIDASQTIDDVSNEINTIVEKTIKNVQDNNKPLYKLWWNNNNNDDEYVYNAEENSTSSCTTTEEKKEE